MVNAILTGFAYQIHSVLETVEFDFMNTNTSQTCPACEFEKGTRGQPVSKGGNMECLACGASWKVIQAENQITHHPEEANYTRASTALVDNRVFNKRHYEPAKKRFRMPVSEEKSSIYSTLVACFLLLISVGLFLQTWVWLNPEHDELVLSNVEIETKTSRTGGNAYLVKGVLSNESSQDKQVPRIAIVLRAKDGAPLVRWYHQSPILSVKSNSQQHFVSSVIYEADNVSYAEASFQ